jgi:hypothetical protein
LAQSNSGGEAELLIGKIFSAAGWQVVYYNQRRGYGFDLWVQKDKRAFVIEVKSSLKAAAVVTLTSLEYEAAAHHKDTYLLAIVEHAERDAPIIHVIQNPAKIVRFVKKQTNEFTAARSLWSTAARKSFPDAD